MYATEDLGDALEATRAFLLPFDVRRWLRVAFVTFFLGGLGTNFSTPSLSTGGGDVPTGPPADGFWLAAGALVAGALAVGLAFAAVRGVMDLVLLESLREEAVDLRRFWTARWRQGLRLFAFRLAVSAAALALVGLPVALIALGIQGEGALLALGVLVLIPVALVVPLSAALLKGFTTAFVAPVMLQEGGGVIAAWRRFWPTLVAEWTEFLAYAVVNFLLVLAGGTALSVAVGAGAAVLAVPFLPFAGAGFALLDAVRPAGVALLALTGVLYAAAVVVVAAFAKAPLMVFLRYYALLVLGDADGDLDLVPLIREAVRATPESDGGERNC